MLKKVALSLDNGDKRKISVCTDPTNKDLTRVKQKNRILDHPKNLLEVLSARLAITHSLTGNNITTGPNQLFF